MPNAKYKLYEAYGVWEVTTEGDCEGRSTKRLGIHEGYIDEIAFALADKVYYSLTFKRVNPKKLDMTPKRDKVSVTLDIDSGTWEMTSKERVKHFQHMLERAGRTKVFVSDNNIYAAVTFSREEKLTEEEKMLNKLEKAGFDREEVKRAFCKK